MLKLQQFSLSLPHIYSASRPFLSLPHIYSASRPFLSLPHITLLHDLSSPFHILLCSMTFSLPSTYYSAPRPFLSLPHITLLHDLSCSVASCLFQESILSRNCSALQHPVFSRNLFYPETTLLCSILSFPGIYSIQELLCSIASCLFQESILSRNFSTL